MSIGDIIEGAIGVILVLFSAIVILGTVFWGLRLPLISGRKGYNEINEGDEIYNSKETPDAVFVRGTKGTLLFLVAIAIVAGVGASIDPAASDDVIITKESLIISLIMITPMLVSYLAGIYSAYKAAQKRLTINDNIKKYFRLSPELEGLFSDVRRKDDEFIDIMVEDAPVFYFFEDAIKNNKDEIVNTIKSFIGTMHISSENKEDLNDSIDKIFKSKSKPEDKLKIIDRTKGQKGARLQNGIIYALASYYAKGHGIKVVMDGYHTLEESNNYVAPFEDVEYCLYILKEHKSLAAITLDLEKSEDWYSMLVAIGYLIMSNNDDEHHDIYRERIMKGAKSKA